MWGAYSRSVPSFADIAAKAPARAGTVAALAASAYSAGVITASANGVLASIDGIALAAGDRLLVRSQATASQNGIYTVTSLGAAGSPWSLTRATDLDSAGEMIAGVSVLVLQGTLLGGTFWYSTAAWTPTTGDPAWTAQRRQDVQIFTASGTWTKPIGQFSTVTKTLIGGGGGGGSGRRGLAATNRYGGGGGGGGGVTETVQAYADMPATESVVVGAGGVGGVGGVANDTNGNPGGDGGNTYTGASLATATASAAGGTRGSGGSAFGGSGGAGGAGISRGESGADGGTITPATAFNATLSYEPTGGGGGGGGRNSGDAVAAAGGGGGAPGRNVYGVGISAGAKAGIANAVAGYSDGTMSPGGGGGGGVHGGTVSQRSGAAGGTSGGGGGGGCGALNGNSGGNGGAGGTGRVIYVTQ